MSNIYIRFFLCVLFFFFTTVHFAFSQNTDDSVKIEKKIIRTDIFQDSRIDTLVEIHKKTNENKQSISGYRVQLFFGSDRKKANDIKSDFLKKYSEISAYLLYQQPNYKLRIGDFRTRLEAHKTYKAVITDFPSAFIVEDEIKLPSCE